MVWVQSQLSQNVFLFSGTGWEETTHRDSKSKIVINAFRNEYPGQITGLNKQSMGGGKLIKCHSHANNKSPKLPLLSSSTKSTYLAKGINED